MTSPEQIEEACEVLHNAYEKAAVGLGWETQQASRKPWADVPEANKATMRAAVIALMDWLAAPPPSAETGSRDSEAIYTEGFLHDAVRAVAAERDAARAEVAALRATIARVEALAEKWPEWYGPGHVWRIRAALTAPRNRAGPPMTPLIQRFTHGWRASCPDCAWDSKNMPFPNPDAALHFLHLHTVLCKHTGRPDTATKDQP